MIVKVKMKLKKKDRDSIISWCQSSIDCDTDCLTHPDFADAKESLKATIAFFKALKRELQK